MEPLTDRSVLEIGEYVSVPYAGKLFSDLGATVTKIEPPDGDVARSVGPFHEDDRSPERSQFFGYLNTGKRSVTLPRGDAVSAGVIRDLVGHEGVDLVVEDDLAAYGIDPAELVDEGVSVVSVSGFGLSGPFREYDAPEIVSWAESGHMNKAGYPDRPPTRPRIQTVGYWTGQIAAIAGASALLDAAANGAPGQHIDLAEREAGTSSLERFTFLYSLNGATTRRTGFGYPDQGARSGNRTVYETGDGYVSAMLLGDRWKTFCEEFLDRPDLAEDERFATRDAQQEHSEEMYGIAEEYLKGEGKWDVFRRLQEHGIPSAVTSTPADLAGFDHLQERAFWEEVPLPSGDVVTMPGFPNLYDGTRPDQERAPRLGEHDGEVYDALGYEFLPSAGMGRGGDDDASRSDVAAGSGDGPLPLEGVRVLDFTWVYAGPHATRLLSALGADVVKVSSENQYDSSPSADPSPYFMEMGLGKRNIHLNLNSDRGREIALELAAEADVVVETYSPGYADRVGLDYETLGDVNPELVHLSMPGWGKAGSARDYRAYGLNVQSMAGLDWVSGFPDDPPTTSGMSWPDPLNSYSAAFAVLVALYRRERTGEGTYVESSLLEPAVSMLHKPLCEYLNNGRTPERVGNRDEDRRFVQGAYPCAGDDSWVAVAVEDDGQWGRLCEAMGRPELVADGRLESQHARLEHHDVFDEVVSGWTSERSPEEVRARLQARGVPAGIVADERDLVERDPQLRARGYFVEHDHPEVGEQTYQGFPFRSSRHDLRYRSRPPVFGEHTGEVLSEWLGMSEAEIEAEDADVLS